MSLNNKANDIVFIGMPGAGKSTVGVVVAKMLNLDFMDADLVIQSQCDKTLQMIIDAMGPEGFIQVENEILSDINVENTVIATGGSAVYSDEAMTHLGELGTIVYLELSREAIASRLGNLQERGVVLKGGIGMSLDDLFDERQPLYEKYADITINCEGLSITEVAAKVAAALKETSRGISQETSKVAPKEISKETPKEG